MLLLVGPIAKFVVQTVGKKTVKKVLGQRPMFARVATFQGQADKLEGAVEQLDDLVKPARLKQKGAKGSYVMVDADAGKVVTITLWNSQEHLDGSAEWAAESIVQTAAAIGATAEPEIEVYEVVVRPEG